MSSQIDFDVSVIGLGYVGLTLAVVLAEVGYRVHGVEKNPAILKSLEGGKAHFHETGLDGRLGHLISEGRFTFSKKPAVTKRQAHIVTVGTPLDAQGQVNLASISEAVEAIDLKDGDLVILRSTVRIGTTRQIVKPILDRRNVSYHLAYCPERTLEGRALAELRTLPQIVGGIDEASTMHASDFFAHIAPSIIRVSSVETAELAKLLNNTYRDYKFAFANEVAVMCDTMGISSTEVLAAANTGYPRDTIPLPGPVGGPCLEKDPYILAQSLVPYDYGSGLILSAREKNEYVTEHALSAIKKRWGEFNAGLPKKVALLGMAFKGRPETNDLRGSIALKILASLRADPTFTQIVTWDPVASYDELEAIGANPVKSIAEAFDGASVVILQSNHIYFEQLDLYAMARTMHSPGIIYDFWMQQKFETSEIEPGVFYAGLGDLSLRAG